jgi:hypothetical protein
MESHVTVKRQPPPDPSNELDDFEADTRLLLEHLRALKRRTGLSLAALATATPFSKSTWHRYLNGDQFPPRAAVDSLARLADTDPRPLLSLWDAASRAQCRTASTPAQAPGSAVPEAVSAPARTRRVRPPRRAGVALAAMAAMAATVAVTAGAAEVLEPDLPAASRAAASCRGRSCEGAFPTSETCARDARTESTVAAAAQVVLLRFSPSCATVWAELRTRTDGAREISIRSGQDELSAAYQGDKSDGYSSPMLAASSPRGAQACAEVAGKPTCTGLYGAPRH